MQQNLKFESIEAIVVRLDHNNTSRLFHTAMLRVLLIAAFVATAVGQLAPHVPDKASPWSWDNCGTKLDRLETNKVSVSGKFVAGNKVARLMPPSPAPSKTNENVTWPRAVLPASPWRG